MEKKLLEEIKNNIDESLSEIWTDLKLETGFPLGINIGLSIAQSMGKIQVDGALTVKVTKSGKFKMPLIEYDPDQPGLFDVLTDPNHKEKKETLIDHMAKAKLEELKEAGIIDATTDGEKKLPTNSEDVHRIMTNEEKLIEGGFIPLRLIENDKQIQSYENGEWEIEKTYKTKKAAKEAAELNFRMFKKQNDDPFRKFADINNPPEEFTIYSAKKLPGCTSEIFMKKNETELKSYARGDYIKIKLEWLNLLQNPKHLNASPEFMKIPCDTCFNDSPTCDEAV